MLSKLGSLDTLAFTERGEELSSKCSVTLFSRAIEGLPKQDKTQMIDWQLRGETDSAGHRLLRVRLEGAIRLECQRCLEAFDYPVQTENAFLLVESESELAIGEDDPEALERILIARKFDGFELLEDELILSLPYVPVHDVCPNLSDEFFTDDEEEAESAKRKNPFKVLKQLKKDS